MPVHELWSVQIKRNCCILPIHSLQILHVLHMFVNTLKQHFNNFGILQDKLEEAITLIKEGEPIISVYQMTQKMENSNHMLMNRYMEQNTRYLQTLSQMAGLPH